MKTLNNKKGLTLRSSKGFTLIEVVLVLAIGGLIFLLAFIAFQQVSANRRDTQRRADGGRIIAELQNYYSDARKYPTFSGDVAFVAGDTSGADGQEIKQFINSYMGGNKFTGPNGDPYLVIQSASVTNATNAASVVSGLETAFNQPAGTFKGRIVFYGSSKLCQGNGFQNATAGDVAVMVSLEKGFACRDSRGSTQ